MGEEITQITTHVTDAEKRLLFQYSDKPKVKALLGAYFGEQIQDLENACWSLFGRLDIDNSEGTQLDGIGAIIGEARQGKSDTEYRIYLKMRIGINTSEGDIERLLSIWSLLTQSVTVQLYEIFPAAICLYTTEPLSTDAFAQLILDLLQQVTGAGISVDYLEVYDPDEAFGFDDSGPNTAGLGNLLSQGTNTSVVANKLVDSSADFVTDGVVADSDVYNNTDRIQAKVVSVEDLHTLILDDNIFTGTGKGYTINEEVGGKLAWIQAS